MENKKPKGFGKFDALMRKLVKVPAEAVKADQLFCPLCGHTREQHGKDGCGVAGCNCKKTADRI